jgi:hypothetical protein
MEDKMAKEFENIQPKTAVIAIVVDLLNEKGTIVDGGRAQTRLILSDSEFERIQKYVKKYENTINKKITDAPDLFKAITLLLYDTCINECDDENIDEFTGHPNMIFGQPKGE